MTKPTTFQQVTSFVLIASMFAAGVAMATSHTLEALALGLVTVISSVTLLVSAALGSMRSDK